MDQLSTLRRILENSRRIVFFGGAGVSTASGIPDFRSDTGLRADGPDPETILSKTFFYLQPEAFFDYYRKHLLFPDAKPNAVHRYLYELEKQDKLRGIVTQNVDGLHKAAGNIRVYELHGNVEPAASFIGDFRGKHMIVINKTPTDADSRAELVIRGDVAEVFEKLQTGSF